MNYQPISDASFATQLHLYVALAAFLIGIVVLGLAKGTSVHKLFGRIWVVMMVIIAISSFWIHELKVWGPWSPIHILSIVTLIGLLVAIYFIRNGNVLGHKITMVSIFFGGLGIAGVLTFAPGRILYQAVIDG